jgi:hypothetical protein
MNTNYWNNRNNKDTREVLHTSKLARQFVGCIYLFSVI